MPLSPQQLAVLNSQNNQAAPLDPNAPSGHSAAYLAANPQFNQTAGQLAAIPPQTPTTSPTTPNTGTPSTNAPQSSNPYLSQVMSLQNLSPAEVSATQDLNTFNTNQQTKNYNFRQEPIAESYVNGNIRSQQELAAIQQIPLQNRLALAQSQRQASLDAAKTGLDYSLKQQELSKPVFGYAGQSGYQLNPTTNKYEPLQTSSQPGGQTSGTINPSTGLSPSASVNDILGYLGRNGVDVTKGNVGQMIAAVQGGGTAEEIISGKANLAGAKAEATNKSQLKFDANGNPIYFTPTVGNGGSPALLGGLQSKDEVRAFQTAHGLVADGIVGPKTRAAMQAAGLSTGGGSQGSSTGIMTKADAQSLAEQTKYSDTTERAFNTANQNLTSLLSFMKTAGVNSGSTIPLINTLQNKVKAGATDPGIIAGYQSAIQGLRAEYAQVLSRGGEVTDSSRASANSLIPDNLTPAQLQQVATRLNIEGTNAIKEAKSQVQAIKNRASGKGSTSSGTSSGSSLWSF